MGGKDTKWWLRIFSPSLKCCCQCRAVPSSVPNNTLHYSIITQRTWSLPKLNGLQYIKISFINHFMAVLGVHSVQHHNHDNATKNFCAIFFSLIKLSTTAIYQQRRQQQKNMYIYIKHIKQIKIHRRVTNIKMILFCFCCSWLLWVALELILLFVIVMEFYLFLVLLDYHHQRHVNHLWTITAQ